jgi:hypothetical protein
MCFSVLLQYVNASQRTSDFVNQPLEQSRYGSSENEQHGSADDHDDEDFHGDIQKALGFPVGGETANGVFDFLHDDFSFSSYKILVDVRGCVYIKPARIRQRIEKAALLSALPW